MAFSEIWYFNYHVLPSLSPLFEISIVHWRQQKIGVQCFDYWRHWNHLFILEVVYLFFFSCNSAALEKENKNNDCAVFLEAITRRISINPLVPLLYLGLRRPGISAPWGFHIFYSGRDESKFCSVTRLYLTLCDAMDCSTPGFLVHHQHLELPQIHVQCVSDAIQPSHPLSSPTFPAFNLSQNQGLSQWLSSSHQVAKVLEFQLQHQSFQWIFRIDFL